MLNALSLMASNRARAWHKAASVAAALLFFCIPKSISCKIACIHEGCKQLM